MIKSRHLCSDVSTIQAKFLTVTRHFHPKPGLTKNASHTISIYGKMLVIHFPCNSIRTENCMKGL